MKRIVLLLGVMAAACAPEPNVPLDSEANAHDLDAGPDTRPTLDGRAPTDGSLDSGPEVDAVRAARVCGVLDTFIEQSGLPGGVVAVRLLNGETHICVAGMADVDTGRTLTRDDRFIIGSVSKSFTAALILLLAEEGLLTLDDPLSRWVPGFDSSDPTLAQLLNHTSGLGEYLFDSAVRAKQTEAHTEAELINVARTKSIVRQPGVRFEYSNTNYLLLGAIATEAGGAHWSAAVRSRILEPLGLTNTFSGGFEPVPGGHVPGYALADGELVDLTGSFHPTVAGAAGAMVSTGKDLLRWGQAYYGGELLSETSMKFMLSTYRVPHAHDDGIYEGAFIGLGNFINVDEDYGETYGHTGGTPGFSTSLRYIERDGRSQVIMLNGNVASSRQMNDLTSNIWAALLL